VVQGMGVVNRIKKGDFIRKLTIIRIGEKANNFQTDEALRNKDDSMAKIARRVK
jgi:hypothetical protein